MTRQAHPDPRTRGTHPLSLHWGGRERHYLLHTPPGHESLAAVPVVFMLHGAGGTARWTIQETGWTRLADQEGFLAVFPEGMPAKPDEPPSFRRNPQLWNDGSGRGPLGTLNSDDVGFLRAILAQLDRHFRIDPRRIYAAGFSNGGGLTFRLGVELSDRLAALAPVAAHCWTRDPKPLRPLPTFYLLGTDDPLAPLDGGEVQSPFAGRTWMPPVPATWRTWAAALGCPEEPELLQDVDGVKIVRHGPGAAGAELRICTIAGLGHHWPGGKGMLNPRLAGTPSDKVRATEVIWEFFRAHPRPA